MSPGSSLEGTLWWDECSFTQWERLGGQWPSLQQGQKGDTCQHSRPEYWELGSSDSCTPAHESKATVENSRVGRKNESRNGNELQTVEPERF